MRLRAVFSFVITPNQPFLGLKRREGAGANQKHSREVFWTCKLSVGQVQDFGLGEN